MKLRALAFCLLLAWNGPWANAQGLPDLGDASAATLSDQQERTIGNRIMREVVVDKDYIDDPEVVEYVNSIGQRLLAAADPPRRQIDFFVVRDDSINAFALVGGHVGIHSGLLTLTQNENELAGVMAHEISHVLQRHQARAVANAGKAQWSSIAALALALLASRGGSSQSSQITEAAVASAGALSIQNQLDYSREFEREADRVGFTLLERAGFDARGMATFFERMQRANRLNEFKGAPSYLRTHPMTTERIAAMQDRLERIPPHMVADTLEYRVVRAKLRAQTGSATEAMTYFRASLEDQTVMRPREDVYGLAYAMRRARDYDGALKTLDTIRGANTHPAFELLAGQLLTDMHRDKEALDVYQSALKRFPDHRGLVYANLELLLNTGQAKAVLADLQERLRTVQDDAKLYEIQARAYAAIGRPIAEHRAQAEAHYRRGDLARAVDQLEIAVKQVRGSDFYELSSAESRLRELRSQLEIQRAAEKALKIDNG